jgi:hypothetical protein
MTALSSTTEHKSLSGTFLHWNNPYRRISYCFVFLMINRNSFFVYIKKSNAFERNHYITWMLQTILNTYRMSVLFNNRYGIYFVLIYDKSILFFIESIYSVFIRLSDKRDANTS